MPQVSPPSPHAMPPVFTRSNRKAPQQPEELEDLRDLDAAVEEPSLGEASGEIKKALSNFISARVELASIEAREAAAFAAKKAVFGSVMGISLLLVWLLTLAGITGVLAPFADKFLAGKASWLPGWSAVIFVLAALHALAALVCLAIVRKKPATPLFELTRKEIENDKQWLKEKT